MIAKTDEEKNLEAMEDAQMTLVRKVRESLKAGKTEKAKELLRKLGFNEWDVELLLRKPSVAEKFAFAEYMIRYKEQFIAWLYE